MKYIILGAGPAGLTIANKLKQAGISNFLLIEKESEAGGLCRSLNVDKYPIDIGGGHFLDDRNSEVNDYLFGFMPRVEWNIFDRDSKIILGNETINHPIEANIWQMGIENQIQYLKSIAFAGCNQSNPMPSDFVEWIYWKLGTKIAEEYMIPYNRKMFGKNLHHLGTYWLDKLPNVSFEDSIRSCIMKKPYGKQPGHQHFYYPKKFGFGELWLRMANKINDNILYNKTVNGIDYNRKSVTTNDGTEYFADIIITTIPWNEFIEIKGMPDNILFGLRELKYSSINIEYIPTNVKTSAHWIYVPDKNVTYHRILVRSNFCFGSDGYWTETNLERVEKSTLETGYLNYVNKYAYPLNTKNKPEIMNALLDWSGKKGVYAIGRWGEHQHYNSDVTVELALKFCERLIDE
jgi:protoporphyrinogen oxidase